MLSMTQLSWGVLHAVSDINIHSQRLAARGGVSRLPGSPVRGDMSPPRKRAKLKRMNPFTGCVRCGVDDSPRWRRGPAGPLTLCNVCGLLYAKKAQSIKSGGSGSVRGQ